MPILTSQNGIEHDARIVNVASVRQISLFRYPGGKTWLVPTIVEWLRCFTELPLTFVDPFTGGGSVPLGVLSEGLADKIVLGEMDPDVSAVWRCVLGKSREQLCNKIADFRMNRKNVISELSKPANTVLDRAFQTLLKNRTFRGGILAPGASLMKVGENGRGVASRWYPETLIKRARVLGTLSARIEFYQEDAFSLIERHLNKPEVVFFIDPPYTAGNGKRAGKRLYAYSELDHKALFELLKRAAGMVLMTYDDCPDVVEMAASNGFQIERIPMKNTHHERKYELLISNANLIRFAQAS